MAATPQDQNRIHRGRSQTIRDLEWWLSVNMGKFGSEPIDRMEFALADELAVEPSVPAMTPCVRRSARFARRRRVSCL